MDGPVSVTWYHKKNCYYIHKIHDVVPIALILIIAYTSDIWDVALAEMLSIVLSPDRLIPVSLATSLRRLAFCSASNTNLESGPIRSGTYCSPVLPYKNSKLIFQYMGDSRV